MNADRSESRTSEDERRPMLAGPKRHHYLPKFYLKGFLGDDGCLAVYDRSSDTVRRQQPENTGVEGHLYTLTDDQGRKRYELEHALSQIESAAATTLPLLIEGQSLTKQQRAELSLFFAAMAVRTPEFLSNLSHANGELIKKLSRFMLADEEAVLSHLREMPHHASKDEAELRAEARGMMDLVRRGNYDVTVHKEYVVKMALPLAPSLAPIFASRLWAVFSAPKGASFITTDAGILLTSTSPANRSPWMGLGHGSPDAITYIPLDATHALAMWGRGGDTYYRPRGRTEIRRMNLAMARQSLRYVIARDDKLVLSLSKAASLGSSGWTPRFQVG